MKKVKLFLVIAIVAIITSCQKDPIVNFTTDKQTYEAGDVVHLTNSSVDADHYIWTMPDGQTSTAKDVDYTTDINHDDGTLTFKLEAFSKNGKKTDEVSKTVNIQVATGDVIFWQSAGTDITTVTINYVSNDITNNYLTAPDCGTTDCACFNNLKIGIYSYYATDGTYEWTDDITVSKDVCLKIELSYKKALKVSLPKVAGKKSLIK